MSNPKPVEGARELLARWRKDICDSQEEYNFLQRCADELEAALSAVPARDGVRTHKPDCLWLTPLPTGAGTWGCDCGFDKLCIELEDYPFERRAAKEQADGQR